MQIQPVSSGMAGVMAPPAKGLSQGTHAQIKKNAARKAALREEPGGVLTEPAEESETCMAIPRWERQWFQIMP